MSRRHHGGRPHHSVGHARPAQSAPSAGAGSNGGPPGRPLTTGSAGDRRATATARTAVDPVVTHSDSAGGARSTEAIDSEPSTTPGPDAAAGRAGRRETAQPSDRPEQNAGFPPQPSARQSGQSGQQQPTPSGRPDPGPVPAPAPAGCTAPQLRRFIKSRPYVPMHELRRRFGIVGVEDDVTGVDVEHGRVFVGLPEREGRLLGELLRGGEIGYELSLDPRTPIVIGLYPMRPVPRG
jgi:hypothetical protein